MIDLHNLRCKQCGREFPLTDLKFTPAITTHEGYGSFHVAFTAPCGCVDTVEVIQRENKEPIRWGVVDSTFWDDDEKVGVVMARTMDEACKIAEEKFHLHVDPETGDGLRVVEIGPDNEKRWEKFHVHQDADC